MTSVTIFGWMREDGTVTWDRDEVQAEMRKVAQGWKNSDAFINKVDAAFDEEFNKSRPRRH